MTQQKSPRIPLCLTTPRTRVADQFWIGLAQLVEAAGYNPLFLLPASDPLTSVASREAFRVVESGRGEVKTILRELPVAAALVDSPRARNGLRAALPWLSKQKVRRVLLAEAQPEQSWFFNRSLPVLYSNPALVGSGGTDDLWLPVQPERIFVSEDRAKEFRRIYQIPEASRIVWLPGGSHNRTQSWLDCTTMCESLLTTDPDAVIVFGRSSPSEAIDTIRDRLFRFGMWRVLSDLSEYEEEMVWSAASVVWLPRFDSEELFEPLIRAVEVGLPVLLVDDATLRQWTAAGFGDEAIPNNFPSRWMEKTIDLLNNTGWESRRIRIREYETRWGVTARAQRLIEWLGFSILRTESSE